MSAIGTLTISKFVAQRVYEDHVEQGSTVCYGPECFRVTHWIVVLLTLSSMLSSWCLHVSNLSKRAYSK
jgi:hypothetical protein